MNFDRLRFVAERAEVGEEREALFAVTIPEERGSFRALLRADRPRAASPSSTTASPTPREAHVFVGVATTDRGEVGAASRATSRATASPPLDLTDDELAKEHVRHMVGGRSRAGRATSGSTASSSPSGPGALMRFLSSMHAGLEHQPVPLPQPGRRLRPHPGRPPGAGRRTRRPSPRSCATLAYPCVDETEQPGLPPLPAVAAATASGSCRATACRGCAGSWFAEPGGAAAAASPGAGASTGAADIAGGAMAGAGDAGTAAGAGSR